MKYNILIIFFGVLLFCNCSPVIKEKQDADSYYVILGKQIDTTIHHDSCIVFGFVKHWDKKGEDFFRSIPNVCIYKYPNST